MYQSWRDLLFLHWQVDPDEVQKRLPPGLTVDTFDGNAYIGIVPFFMRHVRPVWAPSVPGLSDFMELNLRTYVYDRRGVPGVWFYSLDAAQWLAVKIARRFFHLPYYHAKMIARKAQDGSCLYVSRRKGDGLESVFRYRPQGMVRQASPDTLEFFLVERYVLFSFSKRKQCLYAGQVHHEPYGLTDAVVDEMNDALFELNGLPRPGRDPDHITMSAGVDVDIYPLHSRIGNKSVS